MNEDLADILRRGDVDRWNQLARSETAIDLAGLRLHRVGLKAVRLDGTNLEGAEFIGCDLKKASFAGANVAKGNFIKSALHDADFERANVEGARFDRISMPRVNFSEANLRGASMIGAWAEKCKFVNADLSNAVLQAARLSFSDFTNGNLSGADVRLADLRLATFNRADLTDAMLGGASLDRALFEGAILTGTGYSVFKPTLVLPKPGSTKVPSEGDHWEVIFRRSDLRSIYAGNDLLTARCVTCDLDRGREYQQKYLAEIVRSGGLLCIKSDPTEYLKTDSAFGNQNPTGVCPTHSLWLFDQCSFEQSLRLIELFSYAPDITAEGRELIDSPTEIDREDMAKIVELLRDLRKRHRIVITEFMKRSISLHKVDEDNGSWSADVKRVLEFQRKALGKEFSGEELRFYRQYFLKDRVLILG